jgi:hypothetical protein
LTQSQVVEGNSFAISLGCLAINPPGLGDNQSWLYNQHQTKRLSLLVSKRRPKEAASCFFWSSFGILKGLLETNHKNNNKWLYSGFICTFLNKNSFVVRSKLFP